MPCELYLYMEIDSSYDMRVVERIGLSQIFISNQECLLLVYLGKYHSINTRKLSREVDLARVIGTATLPVKSYVLFLLYLM